MANRQLIDAIIMAESGGRANAQNPRSSAGGAGQFINSTWLQTVKKYRPDIAQGRSDAEILNLKFDPNLSREMAAAYDQENAQYLASRGVEPTDSARSLAYFAGPQGAVKIYSNPQARVEETLTPAAIEANPFLRGKTNADVIQWAGQRVHGGGDGSVNPSPQMQASVLQSRFGGQNTSANVSPEELSTDLQTENIGEVGESGIDKLKKQLYDSEKLARASQFEKSADEMNNGSALGAFGSAITRGVNAYLNGDQKSAYADALKNAQDPAAMARILMDSPDEKLRAAGINMLAQTMGPKAAPDIKTFKSRDQWGREVENQAVWNPKSGRYEPLSSLMPGGGSQMPSSGAQSHPQGGGTTPLMSRQPAPIQPGMGQPLAQQPMTDDQAQAYMQSLTDPATGMDRQLPPQQPQQGAPQMQQAPAQGMQAPSGAEPGPAAPKELIGEGFMQVPAPGGGFLWQRTPQGMQPVLQPKAEFEAQARLGEKRQNDQNIASEAAGRAKSVVAQAKELAELPGFEKALEINRARLEYSTPGWLGKADPTTIKQQLERKYAPNDPAWRALSQIESVQNQLVLGLMQLAPQKGPQSDKDAARYEAAVGDLSNATSAADFKLRLNRVMNLQAQLTPGTTSKDYVPESPTMKELQEVYDNGRFDERQVQRLAAKYGLNAYDVQQLASHATGQPTKSQIWIGQ